MGQMAGKIQEKLKQTSNGALLLTARVITGLLLGMTLSLIGQEIFDYGTLLYIFVIVVIAGLFLKTTQSWQWMPLFVFNLICVLVAMLLRMYILIAPGA
jgi:hypothetical protein